MPLYEYECLKCGTRFEQIQKFSDALVTKHSGCGGKVRKLLSAPAIQFKGSGWYVTDYARAGGADRDKKADKDGDRKADKKETKTESKSGSTESQASTESKPASSESSKTAATEPSKR